MTQPDNTWSDEAVKQLETLFHSGLSCSKIAARMGMGLSRNAVIGKLYRLGFSNKKPSGVVVPKEKKKPEKPSRQQPSMPAFHRATPPRPVFAFVEPPHPAGQITVADLTSSMCRWPLGDPLKENFTFCGQAPNEGSPYCVFHSRLGCVAPSQKKARYA